MDERLHEMFRQELSAQERPSLAGMAEDVLRKGRRRARRARTARVASAVLAAVGVVAALALPAITRGPAVTMSPGAMSPGARVKAGSPAKPAAKPSPRTSPSGSPADYIPQPPGPKARTTAAAVLDELLRLLPAGATSDYAIYRDRNQTGAQVDLDGARGLGMIRIFLYRDKTPPSCTPYALSNISQICSTLPGGAPVTTTRIPGNCIERISIVIGHGHDTGVQIDVASCLAWNGQTNPAAHLAITAAQARKIAANPAWGARRMDAAVVKDGARRFADLPEGN